MSGLVTGLVLDRYPNGGGERLVAVALADNAHRDGTRIFPSVAEVAERTKLSRRTVQLHLARMVASGWLILTKKSSGRRGDTNEYRICPGWLAGGECTPPTSPVLRTNAKRLWGAKIAPHKDASWGATSDKVGCNLTQHGVKPIAPKPSGTVIELTPLPPKGGARVDNPETGGRWPGFDEAFWSIWPKKVDQENARRAWDALAPDAALQGEITQAIHAWTRSPGWQAEDGRWIPKASKWLRGKRWRDVPGLAVPPPPPVPTPAPEPALTEEQLRENGRRAREAAGVGGRTLTGERVVVAA
jgi:hypothetical protein